MFQPSSKRRTADSLGNIFEVVGPKKAAVLQDPNQWFNVFYREVVSQIDERPYAVLFSQSRGRPNASIRVLIGMILLKEGFNWSDEQLFETIRFDMRHMLALGLGKADEEPPSPRTYYNFLDRIQKYAKKTGKNLLEQTFESLTQRQIKRFGVDGKEIRMDSKLFSSNIRRNTVYQLAIEVLQHFFKSLSESQKKQIKGSTRCYLEQLMKKKPHQHAYGMTSTQVRKHLQSLGHICFYLLKKFKSSRPGRYDLLERFFHDHFEHKSPSAGAEDSSESSAQREDGMQEATHIERKKENKAGSLQSVHDEEAVYRRKGKGVHYQEVKGYVFNAAEIYARGNYLKLIVSVLLAKANMADHKFFQSAIKQAQRVTGQEVHTVLTDGAYQSPENRDFVSSTEHPIEWQCSGLQGPSNQYAFEWVEPGKSVKVIDQATGHTYIGKRTNGKKEAYAIKLKDVAPGKKPYRYFSREKIENYFRRQEIQENLEEVRKRRANVESTIHHLFCTLNGNKSKYRGLLRNNIFVLLRAMWVNYRRILKWLLSKQGPNPASSQALKGAFSTFLPLILTKQPIFKFVSGLLADLLKMCFQSQKSRHYNYVKYGRF